MLSQKHIEQLDLNAIYTSQPNVKYRGSLYANDLYHCCNWTFKVVQTEEGYAMVDTYWSSGDKLTILLSDENISEFTKLFNLNDVRKLNQEEEKYYHHDDVYRVALDSAGIRGRKLFVNKETTRNKEIVLELMDEKIRSMEHTLKQLKEQKEKVVNDEITLDYIFL